MCAVLLKETDGYHYLQSELFLDYGIRHLFSTIFHEKKEKPVNFGFHGEESREAVLDNYRMVGDILGEPLFRMVKTTQIHETVVRRVTQEDCGKGLTRPTDIENADGFVCGEPHIPLVIFSADCTPILLADKKGRAVGAVHAGWRGTVGGIAKSGVDRLAEEYHIPKEDILCAIGPCISKCCFEVSEDVADAFSALFPMDHYLSRKGNGRILIDLKGVNRELLLRAGIPEANIEVADNCTVCDEKYFYSYRRQKEKAGRMAGFIVCGEMV